MTKDAALRPTSPVSLLIYTKLGGTRIKRLSEQEGGSFARLYYVGGNRNQSMPMWRHWRRPRRAGYRRATHHSGWDNCALREMGGKRDSIWTGIRRWARGPTASSQIRAGAGSPRSDSRRTGGLLILSNAWTGYVLDVSKCMTWQVRSCQRHWRRRFWTLCQGPWDSQPAGADQK